jgi:putative ABC transport system permease protein
MHWRNLFARSRDRKDHERVEEFDAHVHALAEELIERGLSPEEANRRARLKFGNPRVKLEEIDDLRRLALVESVWRDLRYAIRVLRRSPAFALAAVATLALGIGANTAVFSVVEAVLLRPLPYEHPERLVGITYWYQSADAKTTGGSVPSPPVLAWIDQSRTFEAFCTHTVGETTMLKGDGEPIRLSTASISTNFFAVLGVQPVERGRSFQTFDGTRDAEPVVVLSHRLWSQLGSDERTVGATLKLNGRSYTVIGVAPASFRFPGYAAPDVFVPHNLPLGSSVVQSVDVIGRLKPTVTIDLANDELVGISRHAESGYPSAMHAFIAAGGSPQVIDLQHRIAGNLRRMLFIALGAVGCILLLACANVTSLLIARMTGRQRELAMRTALGATPRRLAQWLLAESLVLTLSGAVVSLLLFVSLMAGLRTLLAGAIPHSEAIGVDRPVLVFIAVSVMLTSALCAAIPLARVLRRCEAVGVRLASSGAIGTTVRDSVRRVLVAGEVAGALVLLVGALLLLATIWRLSGVGLGFDATQVATLKISARGLGNSPQRQTDLISEILLRLRTVPGVSAAGASTAFPLSGHAFGFTIPVAGEPQPPLSAENATGVDAVSPGFFGTMRINFVAGRDFDDRDGSNAPRVAIVNKAFARLNFKDRDPLSRRLSLGGRPQDANIAVVGVVDDFKDGNPGDDAKPTVYVPFSQAAPQLGWHTVALAVRTSSDSRELIGSLRRAVIGLAPHSAAYDLATMEDRVAATIAPQRQRAVVFGLFALVAVILAAVGLSGLLASVVAQSMRELGVRLALGATRRDLMGLVVRQSLAPTAIGIVIGLGAALGCSRLLADQLYGVTALDPMTYVAAAGAMIAVSTVASCLPAYRATTVDPITVLRAD